MKTVILGIVLLISVSVSGQTIKIEGKSYKENCINLNLFDFTGFWKIIGRETYTDDGAVMDSLNANRNGIGDYINFNYKSKYFYAFTTLDVVNLIENPIYKKKYYSKNELQDRRFNSFREDSLLVIDIYKKNGDEPFLSSVVINNNLMVLFFDGNSSTYIERVANPAENLGWKEVDGYYSMSGSFGYQKIVLPEDVLKNKDGVLDFVFTPQKNCNETSLFIKNQLNEDSEGIPLSEKTLYSYNNLFLEPIHGSIPLKDLETNIIRVIKGTCEGQGKWNFKWKIDYQSDRKGNSDRGIRYNSNSELKNRIAQVQFKAYIKDNIKLILDKDIKTTTEITSKLDVLSSTDYKASRAILLEPSFEAMQGSVFRAEIGSLYIPQLKLLRANIYGFNDYTLNKSNLAFSFMLDSLDNESNSIVFFQSESIKKLASGQYLVIGKYTVNNNSSNTILYLSTFPFENKKGYVEKFRLSGAFEVCKFPALGFKDTVIDVDMYGTLE